MSESKKRVQAYKVVMSHGSEIPIDAEEVPNVIRSLKTKNICVLKQGIFNPSFFVSIVFDEKRVEFNKQEYKHDDRFQRLGLRSLPDIFKELKEQGLLPSGNTKAITPAN